MLRTSTWVLFSLFVVSIVACSTKKEDSKHNVDGVTKLPPSSELAALMKDMKSQSFEMREALINGNQLDTSVLNLWKAIHTAKPTEEGKTGPIYQGFAAYFLATVDSLKYAADESSNKQYFNVMISSCITCHQELCPGPVKTIKKLKITEK